MDKTITKQKEMKCIGIQVRTNNKKEFNKTSGLIFPSTLYNNFNRMAKANDPF